ncbi:AraC family transcriptional regulator [Amycolatopsis lurida]
MIESVFRSEDVPAADRFDYWRQRIRQSHAPAEMTSDHIADFHANDRLVELAAIQVSALDVAPMRVRRTPLLVRRSDPELYHLTLTPRGGLDATRADSTVTCNSRDWYLHDTSHTYDLNLREAAGCRTFSAVETSIPKALLPLPPGRVEQMLGRRISGREGIGALLADLLTRLLTDTGSYRPADGPRLATVVLDLVAALLAHLLDAEDRLPPETRRRALTRRIQAFIHQHLHNPHLTPGDVAAAHHISTSYLHRLFQDEETTVAAWIRRQRLERARRDLTAPALRATPIHRIATRWGFTHPATFTRAFHAAYGMSPTQHRDQAPT